MLLLCPWGHEPKERAYKLALNILGALIFAAPMYMTARRGVTDPVCGMKVDREKGVTKELGDETYYFCSTHCLHAFEADPDTYSRASAPGDRAHAGD